MKSDSIAKRYLVTLVANSAKLVVGVIAASIVPRTLGPLNYGNFQFVTNISTSIRSFIDLNISASIYTYNSKNPQDGLAAFLYAGWMFLQLIVILAIIAGLAFFGKLQMLWPAQEFRFVCVVAVLEWITFFALFLIQLGESKGESVIVQKINMFSQMFKLISFLLFFYLEILSLSTFILVNYVASIVVIVLTLILLVNKKRRTYFNLDITRGKVRTIFLYSIKYVSPLFVLLVAVLLHDYFEKWFLQVVAGSVEQGYYSLAFQWSSISLLFTTSILSILWREVSYSQSINDHEAIQKIFLKTTKSLFFLSSFIAFYIMLNSKDLLHVAVGDKFQSARYALAVMSLYPIHQTMGQINGTIYYATGRVRQYRNLSVISLFIGIVCTYLFLAPSTFVLPGFGLAALGLSLKIVLVNIIGVNILLFYNSRHLAISYKDLVFFQIKIIFIVGGACILSSFVFQLIFQSFIWYRLIGSAVTQIFLAAFLILKYPSMLGFKKEEIEIYVSKIKRKVLENVTERLP